MITTNPVEERIAALAEPEADKLGLRLVRIRLSGLRRKRLQVMAERIADGGMDVEDCARLSRALSAALDENDPIQGEYDLEVSSPGIDRPLMRIEDFARFVGHEAKLETTSMTNGQKRFKGQIAGVEGDLIRLNTQAGEVALKFSALHDARLVLTDKLIEEDLRRAKLSSSERGGASEARDEESAPPQTSDIGARRPLSHAARDSFPARGGNGTKRKNT